MAEGTGGDGQPWMVSGVPILLFGDQQERGDGRERASSHRASVADGLTLWAGGRGWLVVVVGVGIPSFLVGIE